MRGAEIGAIQCGAAPDMDVPVGLIADCIPVELCRGIGDVGHVEVGGSDAAEAVGDDDGGCPEGVDAVSAVLAHADHVAGDGRQAGEGVVVGGDGGQGGNAVGPGAGGDGHVEGVGSGKPRDVYALIGLAGAQQDGSRTGD